MEISLHFLSRNSLQNASFSPCTPTTSLFCRVAVAISADSGPSGSSIGMCTVAWPEIAWVTVVLASFTVTNGYKCRGGIMYDTEHFCLHDHIHIPHLARLVSTVKWPTFWFLWVLNRWSVVTTDFHELFPLGTILPAGTVKGLLGSRHTPPSLDCETVTLVSLDKQDHLLSPTCNSVFCMLSCSIRSPKGPDSSLNFQFTSTVVFLHLSISPHVPSTSKQTKVTGRGSKHSFEQIIWNNHRAATSSVWSNTGVVWLWQKVYLHL